MENINRYFDEFDPEIEFGLVWDYDMSANLKVEIPFDYYRSSDYSPETDYIDSKVHDFIESTHDEHRKQGYFTAPFLVRCVLRGHDDNSLFVSPPKLMTASLLPPCLDFYDFPDCNRLGLYFRLKGSPVFRLMIRVGRLPDDMAAKVKSVDIYVTRQVPAYSFGGGHRCDYNDVLRSMDTGSPLYDGVDSDDFVLMFRGRYCDSEWVPEFRRHYNDARFSQTPVWYVAPNNRLADMLAAETGFHHVASIDAGDIIGRRSFQTVSIPSTANEWIGSQKMLEEDTAGEEPQAQAPSPGKPKSQAPNNQPAHPCRSMSDKCSMSGMHNMSWMCNMLGIYRVAALCGASALLCPQAPSSSLPEISLHPPASQIILSLTSGLSPPK